MNRIDQQERYLWGINHRDVQHRWSVTAYPPTFHSCFFCMVGTDDNGTVMWCPSFIIGYIGRDIVDLMVELRAEVEPL